jgi:hypothetical protein
MGTVSRWIGRGVTAYLSKPTRDVSHSLPSPPEKLAQILKPCDVLLVEGASRFSTAIKYLTQSTWSHAALYVGDAVEDVDPAGNVLIDVDIVEGIRAIPLSKFQNLHTRIARPIGLSDEDRDRMIAFMIERLGYKYDLKNVIDLARYLLPTPPVPTRWRRRMLALGSGEPTRAICSTLIAEAFQGVRYPILPLITREQSTDEECSDCYEEILHIRHHSLFAPRDFDVSPYFEIVKPTIASGFDYRAVKWSEEVLPIEKTQPARIE